MLRAYFFHVDQHRKPADNFVGDMFSSERVCDSVQPKLCTNCGGTTEQRLPIDSRLVPSLSFRLISSL